MYKRIRSPLCDNTLCPCATSPLTLTLHFKPYLRLYMCYDVAYLTKRTEEYAKRFSVEEKSVEEAKKKNAPAYHAMGYDHPLLPIIKPKEPGKIQLMEWGLIPFFAKNSRNAVVLSNKTLNARGESIFEKPSFKYSAPNKRCLILVDGFFEHYHYQGKTYPFYIKMKDDRPFFFGGLYSYWKNEKEGIGKHTVSLITTKANPLLEKIHNGGANAGRMPFIVPEELSDKWLKIDGGDKAGKDEVLAMIRPYDDAEMTAYTVGRLRGKKAVENTPEAVKEVPYPEMELI